MVVHAAPARTRPTSSTLSAADPAIICPAPLCPASSHSINGLDKIIPLTVLRRAKGFAIFSIFRVGFVLTARAGSGVVIAKLEDGNWSAPSALGIGGIGGGFSAGAEVTDFIVVLNSRAAVKSFMATGSLQLGGNLSLAVGPLGRSAEASGSVSSGGGVAATFSYSKSQGLFGGVSLEGTVLVDRSDANGKAYNRAASAKQILSGSVDVPAFASGLIGTIERLSMTGAMSQAAKAEKIEPGAGRDSWSMDEDDEWSSSSRRNRGDDVTGNLYRSQLSQRQSFRGQASLGGADSSGACNSRDPFAASEDEDDAAYSLDRDIATRNAGTYGFSSAGGGSITNSPGASRSSSEIRQRSSSRSSKITGYFDDLVAFRESRSYSPINGKRPPMGHRKSSSSFSLSKFGKIKTPPPFGSRKTPPVNDVLFNRFPKDFGNRENSSREDDLRQGMRHASPGLATPTRIAVGTSDYNSPSSRRSPAVPRTGTALSNSASYINGRIKKTTPTNSAYLALHSGNPPTSASVRPGGKAPDAFDDIWQSERSQRASSGGKYAGLDELDCELQSVSLGERAATNKRTSSYGNGLSALGSNSYSRYDRPSSVSSKHGFDWGGAGQFRATQQQRDAWTGFDVSSSEDEAASWGLVGANSAKPPNRDSSTTPRGFNRFGDGGTASSSSPSRATTPGFATASMSASPPFVGAAASRPTAAAASAALYSSLAPIGRVAAAFDFAGQETDDLAFQRGDVISVLRKTESTNDWWLGRHESTGKVGSFPANFTESLGEV